MKWCPTVAGCSQASGLQAGCRFAGASRRESLNFEATPERQRRDGVVSLAHGMILWPRMLASHLIPD
jgi:hypothetical protein